MHRARAADERCQHWSCDKRAAASTPPGRGDRDFARRVADAAPSAERDPPRASASTEGPTPTTPRRTRKFFRRRFHNSHVQNEDSVIFIIYTSSRATAPVPRPCDLLSPSARSDCEHHRDCAEQTRRDSRTPERARASASCPLDRLQHTRRHGAWQDYQHRLLAVKTARQCARACKSAMKPGSRERASAGPARADGESL